MTTMKRVAEAAGVSVMTVSNAYGHPDRVSAATRERVLTAARQVGYDGPHPLARSLRTGRTGAVGVLVNEPLSYAFADPAARLLLAGLSEHPALAETALTLLPAPPSAAHLPELVRRALVDAFVAYSTSDDDPGTREALRRPVPVVLVDTPGDPALRPEGAPPLRWVGVDDRGGARAVAAHLRDLGHTRIGLLVDRASSDGHVGPFTPERQAATPWRVVRERLAGWRDALGDLSALPAEECAGNAVADGAAGVARLLARDPDLTAVLALTDQLALGALPSGLSVVGFDDVPEAEAAGLTSVRQPLLEKGRSVGRLLAALLAGQVPEQPEPLPTELVVRTSARPAPR